MKESDNGFASYYSMSGTPPSDDTPTVVIKLSKEMWDICKQYDESQPHEIAKQLLSTAISDYMSRLVQTQ